MTRRIEYTPDEVMQVMDLGYELEVWFLPSEDVFAPSYMRACRMCYDNEGRIRQATYGQFAKGEESMCKAHHRRRQAGVSEEGMRAPIGDRGRPRVNQGECTVDGCGEPQKTKTLCNTHYMASWRGASKA